MKKSCLYLLYNILILLVFVKISCAMDSETLALTGSTEEIYQEILKGLQTQNFNEPEKILNKLLVSKRMSVDGKRTLEEVYEKLRSFQDENTLNIWCEKSKASHFPFSVRGNYYVRKAINIAGSQDVGGISEERWKIVAELYKKAKVDFEKAYSIAPSDPNSPSSMANIGSVGQDPSEITERWFKRAVEGDNFWLAAYRAKLNIIWAQSANSGWNGRIEKEAESFLKSCYEQSPKGSGVYLIVFKYLEYMTVKYQAIGEGYMMPSLGQGISTLITDGIKRFRHDFPKSSLPDYYEGLYYYHSNNNQEALIHLGKALEKAPDNIEALQTKINANIALDQLEKAEVDLQKLLSLRPQSSFALANLGAIQINLHNDVDKGIELFSKACSLEPDTYFLKNYYFSLAQYLAKKEKFTDAIAYFTKALEVDASFSRALLYRGTNKYKAGDINGALEDMIALQKMGGNYAKSAKNLAEKYMQELAKAKNPSSRPQDVSNQSPQISKPLRAETPSKPGIGTADIQQRPVLVDTRKVSKESIEQQFAHCEGLYFRKMRDESTACFSDLVAVAPEHAESYYMLGKIAENLEYDAQKAAKYYGIAVTKDAKNEKYILSFGELLYLQHLYQQAISVATKLIEMNPANGKAYYLRGRCFDASNQEEEAIKDMQLAKMYGEMTAEVEQYLQKHTKREIEPPKIGKIDQLMMLVDQNFVMRRFDEAEKQLNEIIKLNPKHDYAHFRLGLLYIERDREHQKALTQFDKAIALNKDSADYLRYRANTLRYLEKFKLAIEDYTRAIALKPKEGVFYGDRADCYEKIGEFKKAEADFHSALQYADGSKDYYNSRLAQLSVKTGTSFEITSSNIPLLIERGKAYKNKKEYELAKKDFLKAIELDPSSAAPFYELGMLYFEKLNNTTESLVNLSKAIELNKGNRDYFFKRGLVYYGMKDFAKAKTDFSAAIGLSPNDGQILYYRGYCNKELGLRDQAIDDFLNAKKYAPSWTASVDGLLEEMK